VTASTLDPGSHTHHK